MNSLESKEEEEGHFGEGILKDGDATSFNGATTEPKGKKKEADTEQVGVKQPEDEDDDNPEDDDEKPAAGGKEQKNLLVDHTYTNYAILSDKELRLLDENSDLLPEPNSEEERKVREKLRGMSCTYGPMKKSAGGVVQPFPGKVSSLMDFREHILCSIIDSHLVSNILMFILQLMDVLDRSDLLDTICWMPHGRAFIVKKPKLFAVDVLPRFFKQTKYLSFTRQLNLWGFKRITKGLDGGAYYHELFLRGRPYLAMRMKRHKVKGTGIKLTPNPKDEPLFYRDYPYMEQLDETRAQGPLPPLPPDRVAYPEQETSQGVPTAHDGMALAQAQAQQQLQHMGHYQYHPAGMGAPHHPFLAGSQAGPLGGEMPGFPYNRAPAFGGDAGLGSYGGLPGLSGMGLSGSPNAMMGASPGAYSALGGYSAQAPSRDYNNVLFAPGVTWGSVAASGRVNDPIQDELTAMIRNRQSQTASATEMFPSQNLTSDRLLMERLRDVDRAAQLKREQQDINMIRRGGKAADAASAASSAFSAHANNFAFSGPSISNGLGNSPFDRYRQPSAMGAFGSYEGAFGFPPAAASAAAAPGAQSGTLDNEQQAVESSVKEALREANHLEELALAQRAKARNIALAGALKMRMGAGLPDEGAAAGGNGAQAGEADGKAEEGASGLGGFPV